MKTVSRRNFIKKALAGITVLTSASIFASVPTQNKELALSVDKDGNATLQGAVITVDTNCNATLKQERDGYIERD